MKDKYIVYNLSLHMTETDCARGVRSVYTEDCKLRARAPTNYCEVGGATMLQTSLAKLSNIQVTVLSSLKSSAKRLSKKACAGYNISKYY